MVLLGGAVWICSVDEGLTRARVRLDQANPLSGGSVRAMINDPNLVERSVERPRSDVETRTSNTVAFHNWASRAVFNNLAIDDASGTVFAANFASGMIEMYRFDLATAFTDPSLPDGYGPIGVSVIDGKLYVAFVIRGRADGAGGGGRPIFDVFSLDGDFEDRLVSEQRPNSP